jgi:hypothetical protein
MDLITWLRAQLDEDERVARAFAARLDAHLFETGWGPARVLAEVDAKRRILDLMMPGRPVYPGAYGQAYRDVLRLLALPYADRDGYRDEWRP